MFSLSESDTAGRILDCGGGPASFNAEMTAAGHRVISMDPIYAFDSTQIEERVRETYPKIMDGVRRAYDRFVWEAIASPEHLGEMRLEAMHKFLADFNAGRAAGRYQVQSLPQLTFADDSFDLALVSHLLFLYSDEMDCAFHIESLRELLRVAAEVRVFPLLAMDGNPSPHITGVTDALAAAGCSVRLQKVNYEFQRGGNTMLVAGRS